MTTSKDIMKEIYDAGVLTVGAIGISYLSKKVIKQPLGVPENINGAARLAVAFGLSAAGVKYLQDKKYLPDNPFNTVSKSGS